MIWDEYYVQYLTQLETTPVEYPTSILDGFQFLKNYFSVSELKHIAQEFKNASDEDIDWFVEILKDEQGKWFGVCVIHLSDKPYPEALFAPMIRAAVYEPNPSLNRAFVECAFGFGRDRVHDALLDYIEAGTNVEGGVAALYWSQIEDDYIRDRVERRRSLASQKSPETKGIILHGPTYHWFTPISEEILKILFGPNEVVTVAVRRTLLRVTRMGDASTHGFLTGKKNFDGEYRLFGHCSSFLPTHIEGYDFPPGLNIIGRVIAFEWFVYRYYTECVELLEKILKIAKSDKIPFSIMIDKSPPTEIIRIRHDPLFCKIEDKSVEEILELYQPPNEIEIDALRHTYNLEKDELVIIDLTEPESVIDGMSQCAKYFDGFR